MDPTTPHAASRRRTLWVLRIFWFALIAGQLAFGFVAYIASQQEHADAQTQLRLQMFLIAVGTLIGAVGLGYFLRNQIYKRCWQTHCVTPQGFFMGNLLLFALLDAVSLLTFVFVMMSGQLFPMILPAIASLAVQIANFPNGLPMDSTLPDFVQDTK
jgi:hypothetical protein